MPSRTRSRCARRNCFLNVKVPPGGGGREEADAADCCGPSIFIPMFFYGRIREISKTTSNTYGTQGDTCESPPPGPPPGWNNCVIGCNPGNPGDPINVGPPCQPISSCIAYSGKPKQGTHCDGAQFAVGDPVAPGNENANNTAFFVNTEAGLWQNGQVVGDLYQGTYSANGTGQSFFGIQITNNASWNFGTTIGINFGPVDVGVGGGYGVNDVSHVQWWNGKIPPGVNARNCWKSYPVQGA